MKKLKYDCKGSVLIILLLTISVVVLIGTVALSFAVKNYKIKRLNSSVKQTLYLAEAGVEEAYVITNEFIEEAIKYAISKAEEFEEIETKVNVNLESTQYSINNEIEKEKYNIVFNRAFKSFIKGTCNDISPNDGLIAVLKKSNAYVTYNNGYPKIDPKLTEFTDYFIIEIKSIYMKGSIKKEIKLICKIIIPEYDDCILSDDLKLENIIKVLEWKMER